MTTALAIRPAEQALEFRRCTGHCCDPITLSEPPGYFQRWRRAGSDVQWIAENLAYLGWRPPSQGGWPGCGTHLYRCPHFDPQNRKCLIYGQGKRTRPCREHPEYDYGPWTPCTNPFCTRRTIVLGMDDGPLRWRFPVLWHRDLARWKAYEEDLCRPETGPECMPEGADE